MKVSTIAAGALLGMQLVSSAGINVASGARLKVGGTVNASAVNTAASSTLEGSGTLNAATTVNGVIQPDPSPGVLNTGSLEIGATGTVALWLGSAGVAGVDFDQIRVSGSLALQSGASLQLSGDSITLSWDEQIILLDNDGVDAVAGTFNGIAEGAAITLPSGTKAYLTYQGGDGNDIMLHFPDNDHDGISDQDDPDDDNDGISDVNELAGNDANGQSTGYGPTNPNDADTDGDGFHDNIEVAWGTDPLDIAETPISSGMVVTVATDEDNGNPAANDLSLREVIGLLNLWEVDGTKVTIHFDASLDGATITLFSDLDSSGQDLFLDSSGLTNGLTIANGGGGFVGTGSLTITGSDTIYLSGSHALSNGLSLHDGVLGLQTSDAAGSGAIRFVPTLEGLSDGTPVLRYADGVTIANTIDLQGPGILEVVDGASARQTGIVEQTGGDYSLTKTGAGVLTLSDTVTYDGEALVSGGTLKLLADLGASSLSVASGATLEMGDGGTSGSVSGPIANSGAIIVDRSDEVTAAITGAGSLQKLGVGTLVLASSSLVTGATSVDAGVLNMQGLVDHDIANEGTLIFSQGRTSPYVVSGTGDVIFAAGYAFTKAQTFTGHTTVLSGIYLAPQVPLATSGMTLSGGNLIASANFNTIDFPIDGNGSLGVSNTLTITSASTFSGTVSVGTGALIVNNTTGSALGSASVSFGFQDGGGLYGTGAISGTVSVGTNYFASNTISPGSGGGNIGELTVGSLNINGIYRFEANGPNHDRLRVTGNLDIGPSTIQFSGSFTEPYYILASYGGLSGFGSFFIVEGLPAGYSINYAYNDGSSSNNVAIVRSLTAYESWAQGKGLDISAGGNHGMSLDNNGDGKPQYYDFAFDGEPLGAGVNQAKLPMQWVDDSGTNRLGITIPVRVGASYSGNGVGPTLTVDGVRYTIYSNFDFGTTSNIAVKEVSAITTGLPTLSPGYEYRSFVMDGMTLHAGFIWVQVGIIN